MNALKHPTRILIFVFFVSPLLSFASTPVHQAMDISELDLFMNRETEVDSVYSTCDKSIEYCKGKCEWSDGITYEGEFQYGIPHGEGVLKWPNGNTYTGQLKGGLRHGTDTQLFYDGSKYEGDWVNGKREGQGYLVSVDADEYLGEFKNDEIHGEGAILWSNGESYSGHWENGQRHGEGTFTRKDGSKYTGMNQEGERHGEGIITWETGDTLHGVWKNGSMDQKGVFEFADGSSMINYWENGQIADKATYVQPNGFTISGSPSQLANLVFKTSLGKSASIEDNLGLAFYAIGLEFKSTNDFGKAENYLEFAMQFKDPSENSDVFDMIEVQMASLLSEEEDSGEIKAQIKEDKKE